MKADASAGAPPALPLEGVTIIDFSWHLAGPYCTLILADLGARVIKIEQPGSSGGYDPIGFARRYFNGQDAHYLALNRNKESIALNLKDPAGIAIVMRLVEKADVVFNNFRPGVMDRLGLGYEDVKNLNPAVIYASLSAFGQDGPYATRPGVDLVIQALSAGMSMTGEAGRAPVRAGIPIADLAGGMWSAISILAALKGPQRGALIDVGLLDGQIAMLPYFAAYYFLDGSIPGPQGSGGHSPTYGAYACADGKQVVVAVTTQAQWLALCEALESPAWAADPRFATAVERNQNSAALTSALETVFLARDSEAWLPRLLAKDIPAAAVNGIDAALSDPQVRHRGMVVEIEHVLGGSLKFVASPVHIAGVELRYRSAPLHGQHTESVLSELGIGEEDQLALRTSGVI